MQNGIAVTAVRTGSGKLLLIGWSISPDGKIERRGDSGNQAGGVGEIAMAGSVTAVRNDSGNLELISWRVSPDGREIKRLADSGTQAGEASSIAISQFSPTRFVTAVRAGNGSLKLIAFDVDSAGAITRTGDSGDQAGAVSDIALATPTYNKLTTAVRNGSGNLEVINWTMQG